MPADSLLGSGLQTFLDSLVMNFKASNLKSRLRIEEGNNLRIILDPRSGDYISLNGYGDLDFSFDRTGNIRLTGVYNISKGVYQISNNSFNKKGIRKFC